MEDNTNLWSEIIYISETMREAKERINKIDSENNELKKDAQTIALELYISEKCHKAGFYGTGKQLIKFILQGNTKAMIDRKFDILLELISVYQKIAGLVGEIKEEQKGENTNGK